VKPARDCGGSCVHAERHDHGGAPLLGKRADRRDNVCLMLAIDVPSVIFIAVLGVVALAVVRGFWGIFRDDRQLDISTSWGRQLFGRWKKS
jgi:hypothetical protein